MMGGNLFLENTYLYKSSNKGEGKGDYYLLFDGEAQHYNPITRIKSFLASGYFCNKCHCTMSNHTKFKEHACNNNGIVAKKPCKEHRCKIQKDSAHYIKREFCKGGEAEIQFRVEHAKEDVDKEWFREKFEDEINHPTYIVFDFETDTSTGVHLPNHVEYTKLKVDKTQL
jgi:hypothetical protein